MESHIKYPVLRHYFSTSVLRAFHFPRFPRSYSCMHHSIPELCTWTALLWSRVISLLSSACIKGTWRSSCKARLQTFPDPADAALEKHPGSLCRKVCTSLEHAAGCGFMEVESYFNPLWGLWGSQICSPLPRPVWDNKTCASLGLFPPSKLTFQLPKGFLGGSVVKNPPAKAGDMGSIPGWGRSPGGGNDNLLQYSWLGNPMDRGVWWATAHGVAKNLTWLSEHTPDLSSPAPSRHLFSPFVLM